MEDLPTELLWQFFYLLPTRSVVSFCSTNREYHQHIDSDVLWSILFKRDYPLVPVHPTLTAFHLYRKVTMLNVSYRKILKFSTGYKTIYDFFPHEYVNNPEYIVYDALVRNNTNRLANSRFPVIIQSGSFQPTEIVRVYRDTVNKEDSRCRIDIFKDKTMESAVLFDVPLGDPELISKMTMAVTELIDQGYIVNYINISSPFIVPGSESMIVLEEMRELGLVRIV